MRNAFASELTRLAGDDERIVLLSGDIGNRLFDPFKERFPERFYNCGVAEAGMMGMAAGMAMCGLRPVVYTIVPFVTTRCLEQIRVDVCYHGQPVVIVGVGGGLSYASLGPTHHSCEDIALLRVLPGMTVVCPGDASETGAALEAAVRRGGPVYIRIGKKGEPAVHTAQPDFEIGRSLQVVRGSEVALLAVGNVLPIACEAAEILESRGLSASVDSFHTVKPLDERRLHTLFSERRLVAVVEEHSRLGGAGSAVAEWLTQHHRNRASAGLLSIGTEDRFFSGGGGQSDARREAGLTAAGVATAVTEALEGLEVSPRPDTPRNR